MPDIQLTGHIVEQSDPHQHQWEVSEARKLGKTLVRIRQHCNCTEGRTIDVRIPDPATQPEPKEERYTVVHSGAQFGIYDRSLTIQIAWTVFRPHAVEIAAALNKGDSGA